MKIFKDIPDCISRLRNILLQYPNLRILITEADLQKWERRLQSLHDFEDYLFNSQTKLNLLNTLVLAVLNANTSEQSDITKHGEQIIANLEYWLSLFQHLKTDKKFKDKLYNLEGFTFLATLSELSLAAFFASKNLNVSFETPFTQRQTTTRKDIDITVSDANGDGVNFEVYMPTHQVEAEGFVNFDEKDDYFDYKVQGKLSDKFGTQGIAGLSGKTLLAVNYAFFDDILIKSFLSASKNHDLFKTMKANLPADVDGIFFFQDYFKSANSFTLDVVVLK